MEIAIIAHDLKKELMTQFCIAYCGILSKHNLCATAITAKYISEATGLNIDRLMSGEQGGEHPFKRFGEPEELCGTIHYLISDAAKFVTGTVAVVDGGFNTFAM